MRRQDPDEGWHVQVAWADDPCNDYGSVHHFCAHAPAVERLLMHGDGPPAILLGKQQRGPAEQHRSLMDFCQNAYAPAKEQTPPYESKDFIEVLQVHFETHFQLVDI